MSLKKDELLILKLCIMKSLFKFIFYGLIAIVWLMITTSASYNKTYPNIALVIAIVNFLLPVAIGVYIFKGFFKKSKSK